MRTFVAICFGLLISFLTKILKIGGGSAAPGLYALRIAPNIVVDLAAKIPRNIVVTGTNGKTTTAKLIAHFAKSKGLNIIHNHTGSNLERGIASTLLEGVRMFHPEGGIALHLPFDLGIWELDEAAFNGVSPKLNPKLIIFLNAFRDQLDRYGEVDSIVRNWQSTLNHTDQDTQLLINGDDSNTSKLKNSKQKILSFGLSNNKIIGEKNGQGIKVLNLEAKNIKLDGLKGSSFHLQSSIFNLPVKLPLPGIYHIYDFLAAFGAGLQFGMTPEEMIASLKDFSPAFGRVEKVKLGLKEGYIFLIKNPVGATQVLITLSQILKSDDTLLIALNDNVADGTDVSWIWDAEFERLLVACHSSLVACSGTRAYDLALRLKYAGIKTVLIEPYLKIAFEKSQKISGGRIFILPTYTAMLELQSILIKSGMKKNYWEEV